MHVATQVNSVEAFDAIKRGLGYDIECRQLAPRGFQASVLSVGQLADLVVCEWMTGPVEVSFVEPDGCLSIWLPASEGRMSLNGHCASQSSAFVLVPGRENRLVAPTDIGIRVVRVPYAAVSEVLAEGAWWEQAESARDFTAPGLEQQTIRRIEYAIDRVTTFSSKSVDLAYQALLAMILPVVVSSVHGTDIPPKIRSLSMFQKAASYIDMHLFEQISVDDLGAALNASVRSVQRMFKQVVGMAPTEYIVRRRLNVARRRLLLADPSTTSVSDIALQSGFGHLGRFSAVYRNHFKEYPRDTFAREAKKRAN